MSPALPLILRNSGAIVDPRRLPHLAAWYDISDASSLSINGSNQVQLIADKSGNSGVNCLVLNGAAGNYASAPDSAALSITGDIDIRVRVAANDWTAAASQRLVSKRSSATDVSYDYHITTTGLPSLITSANGSTLRTGQSTAAVPFSDLQGGWLRVTRNATTGDVTHYWAADSASVPSSWTQLGDVVATTAEGIFNGTQILELGSTHTGTTTLLSGRIYRVQIYNGIAGTLAFDANFALPAKLATSFTESSSNAATVTINTSGDLGARISGERDYINMTAAGRPVYTGGTRPYITGDGSADYARTPPFSLGQAWMRYVLMRHVTWTSGDYLLDGANGANSGALTQTSSTPQLNISAGSSVAANTDLAVNTWAVVTMGFNGASSFLRINRLAPTTGNAGSNNANGLTLFASGASTAANFGNAAVAEDIVYSVVHPRTIQDRVIAYLLKKKGVA